MGGRAPVVPVVEPLAERASLSPGLASLLRRANGSGEMEIPVPVQPARAGAFFSLSGRLIQVSLFLADALLVGLATWMVLGSRGRLGWGGGFLCLAALSVGAWLSCLALWLERPES